MNQHVAHQRSDEIHELRAEIERLQAALALSQSQNYCTFCGRDLDRSLAAELEDKS